MTESGKREVRARPGQGMPPTRAARRRQQRRRSEIRRTLLTRNQLLSCRPQAIRSIAEAQLVNTVRSNTPYVSDVGLPLILQDLGCDLATEFGKVDQELQEVSGVTAEQIPFGHGDHTGVDAPTELPKITEKPSLFPQWFGEWNLPQWVSALVRDEPATKYSEEQVELFIQAAVSSTISEYNKASLVQIRGCADRYEDIIARLRADLAGCRKELEEATKEATFRHVVPDPPAIAKVVLQDAPLKPSESIHELQKTHTKVLIAIDERIEEAMSFGFSDILTLLDAPTLTSESIQLASSRPESVTTEAVNTLCVDTQELDSFWETMASLYSLSEVRYWCLWELRLGHPPEASTAQRSSNVFIGRTHAEVSGEQIFKICQELWPVLDEDTVQLYLQKALAYKRYPNDQHSSELPACRECWQQLERYLSFDTGDRCEAALELALQWSDEQYDWESDG